VSTSRWDEALDKGATRRGRRHLSVSESVFLATGRQLGLVSDDQPHTVRPFYREPGLLVRWWLCSCGQSIVRVRPRPYPPKHA
jgi:hypothetical protein